MAHPRLLVALRLAVTRLTVRVADRTNSTKIMMSPTFNPCLPQLLIDSPELLLLQDWKADIVSVNAVPARYNRKILKILPTHKDAINFFE